MLRSLLWVLFGKRLSFTDATVIGLVVYYGERFDWWLSWGVMVVVIFVSALLTHRYGKRCD